MPGTAVIVIILVPVLFQIVYHNIQSKNRHEEIKKQLEEIEKKLKIIEDGQIK